jgi:hypothetical protein
MAGAVAEGRICACVLGLCSLYRPRLSLRQHPGPDTSNAVSIAGDRLRRHPGAFLNQSWNDTAPLWKGAGLFSPFLTSTQQAIAAAAEAA